MKNWQLYLSYIFILLTLMQMSCKNCNNKADSNNDLSSKLQTIIDKKVNDKSVYSCVVSVLSDDGNLFWTGAGGIANPGQATPMTADTPYYIASITKLFTATVIMQLYEEGQLSLDDPMAKYLPSDLIEGIHIYKGVDYSKEITIRQLLSHTSGIADYYSQSPSPKKSKKKKNLFEEFLDHPEQKWSVDDTIAHARKNLEPNFTPGTKGKYSDTNFQLLGKIIESITKKSLAEVYKGYIFTPAGLDHTWLVNYPQSKTSDYSNVIPIADIYINDKIITGIRTNGTYWADGGIISTAGDCILFLKALREGQLIKSETLEMMHHWVKIDFPLQYGFGTMCFELPVNWIPLLWGHSGSSGSFLYYCEENHLYIAGTINQTSSNIKPFFLIKEIMNTIVLQEE
jgi:D-alanyl-D-alanine carboxypeptidase